MKTYIACLLIIFLSCFNVYADVSWRMLVLPDTQNYTTSAANAEVFYNQTQWIADNVDLLDIELVLHLGDITENNTADEWSIAKQAMSTLDGVVPYMLSYGNHDIWPKPVDKDTLMLNDYFHLSDNPLNSFVVEKVPGDLSNTYGQFISPDGRQMTVISLEYLPNQNNTVYPWARNIAAQNPEDTVVLFTHDNLDEHLTQVTSEGEPISVRNSRGATNWSNLTKTEKNIELMLSGHSQDNKDTDPYGKLTTARLSEQGTYGNTVHEITFNSQEQSNGGNGYLRIFEFLDDGTTVQVKTYSPFLDTWLTNDRNEFQIQLSPLFSADLNNDGDIDELDLNIWKENFGSSGLGDIDHSGLVNGKDFLLWQRQNVNNAPIALFVPESSSMVMCVLFLSLFVLRGDFYVGIYRRSY